MAGGTLVSEELLAGTGSFTTGGTLRSEEQLSGLGTVIPAYVPAPSGLNIAPFPRTYVSLPTPTLTTKSGRPKQNWPATVTRTPWGTLQIIIAGHDVTFFRNVPAEIMSWASEEPFGDAEAILNFPQISTYENADADTAIPWLRPGADVLLRRRDAAGAFHMAYSGFIASQEDAGDGSLAVHCVGCVFRADWLIQPPDVNGFSDTPQDIYNALFNEWEWARKRKGLPIGVLQGSATGILTRERGSYTNLVTGYMQDVLSTSQTTGGSQYTIKLTRPRTPVLTTKDRTTEHWTVDCGAPGVSVEMSADWSQTTTVEYGSGTDDSHCSWRNLKTPNLIPPNVPAFPLSSGSTFTPGSSTTGFDPFSERLRYNGYDLDSDNTYLASDEDEVRRFQTAARITIDGIVGGQTWTAAWQTDLSAEQLKGAFIAPIAEAAWVDPYAYNAAGQIVGVNPNYSVTPPRVERYTAYGDRVSKKTAIASAKQRIARDQQPGYSGTVTLTTDPAQGSRFDIEAGHNIRLHGYRGIARSPLVHIARAQKDWVNKRVVLTVDEHARDLMELAAVLQRRRDVIDPAGRTRPSFRSAKITNDWAVWSCEDGAGIIPLVPQFGGLWNVLPILAGERGSIARVRLAMASGLTRSILHDDTKQQTLTGPTYGAIAIFGKPVSANQLADLLGNPLVTDGSGNNPWDVHADALDAMGCQYAAGGPGQAAGYYPLGDDGTGANLTGWHLDSGGFEFKSYVPPFLYVAIYTAAGCNAGGRLYPGADA